MEWVVIELVQVLYLIAFCLTQAAFKYETIFRVSQVLLNNGTDLSSAIANVPSEVTCGYICLHDDTCKAFFYDNSTLLCKPEQQCRQNTSGLFMSEGVSYYTMEGECREKEAFPTNETETENIVPIYINVTQTDAYDVCLDYGYLLIKVTSASDLSVLIEIFSMLRDYIGLEPQRYWTGHFYDTDGHLFCMDDEATTGRCGLLQTCYMCQPCLQRAPCKEEHPFICL